MTVTVTIPPSSYKLTTITDFKVANGITTVSDDAIIGHFIDRASAQITAYCNRSFALETITETIVSNGSQYLKTSKFAINTLTSVSYNAYDGNGLVVVDPTLYSLDQPELGYIYNDNGWNYSNNRPAYSVIYTTGYTVPGMGGAINLPPDISDTCINIASINWYSKSKDRNIVRQSSPDIGDIMYRGAIRGATDGAAEILSMLSALNPYKRFNL